MTGHDGGGPATPGMPEPAPAPATNEPELALAEVRKRLADVSRERDEAHGRYLRALADFDNYQKRERRERERFRDDATRDLLKELLPVADDIDMALQATASDSTARRASGDEAGAAAMEAFAKGFSASRARLLSVLAKRGVEPLGVAAGDAFDPTRHEAVSAAPCPGLAKDDVGSVLREGYRLGQTVLRPAMVQVRQAAPPPSPQPGPELAFLRDNPFPHGKAEYERMADLISRGEPPDGIERVD